MGSLEQITACAVHTAHPESDAYLQNQVYEVRKSCPQGFPFRFVQHDLTLSEDVYIRRSRCSFDTTTASLGPKDNTLSKVYILFYHNFVPETNY